MSQPQSPRIGVFFAVEPELRTPADEIRSIVDLAQTVEDLGFHSLWVASRHLSPTYAAIGSPLVLLAAAAAKTTRLVLGTSIVSLPMENEIRIAEDFGVLDAIASGRARLGVGSGDDPLGFKAFGLSFDERQGRMSAMLPKLLEILDSGVPLEEARLPLVPSARSNGKVFIGAQSARGAAWAGSLGVGLLQGRSEPKTPDPTASQARAAEAYREVFPEGEVITARNVWLGSIEDPLFAAGVRRHSEYLVSRRREPLPENIEEAARKMHVTFGSAAGQVMSSVLASVSPIKPNELLLTVDAGGLPAAEREKRLIEIGAVLQSAN